MRPTLAQLILPCNSPANGAYQAGFIRLADMGKTKPTRRTITPEDIAAAARLKVAWDMRKRERAGTSKPLLQEEFAVKLGAALGRKSPTTQSLVSQYLNANIALNYKALIAFCDELQWPPTEIRNDLPEQQAENRDPLRSIYGDIKALRFAVLGLIGMVSEMRPVAEPANVKKRIFAATEDDKVFRAHGYLGSLLELLEKAEQRAARASERARRRAAS